MMGEKISTNEKGRDLPHNKLDESNNENRKVLHLNKPDESTYKKGPFPK